MDTTQLTRDCEKLRAAAEDAHAWVGKTNRLPEGLAPDYLRDMIGSLLAIVPEAVPGLLMVLLDTKGKLHDIDEEFLARERRGSRAAEPDLLHLSNKVADVLICLDSVCGQFLQATQVDGRLSSPGLVDREMTALAAVGSRGCDPNKPPPHPNQSIKAHKKFIWGIAVCDNWRTAATASGDKTVKIWDIWTGKSDNGALKHKDVVRSVDLNSNGDIAISVSSDLSINIWDAKMGYCRKIIKPCNFGIIRVPGAHIQTTFDVAISGNGNTAVTASRDKTVKVWNVENGECKKTLTGHQGPVTAVALSPDERMAVSVSDDKSLKTWNLGTGNAVETVDLETGLLAVAVTPNGNVLAGDDNGILHILTLPNLAPPPPNP